MTQLDRRAEQRAREEQASFEKLVERIRGQFPDLDQDVIVRTVQGQYGRFEASPIRDFLPILVERSVRAELRKAG